MTIQAHDFSRPPGLHPETKAKLAEWFTRSNSLLVESLAAYSVPIEIRFDDCVTAWPLDSLGAWSEKTFAFRVNLKEVEASSMMALPNPLAQVLISLMLGATLAEWPEERDLTLAELSVGEYFLTTVLDSLKEGWSGDRPMQLQIADREFNLRRTKNFRLKEPFVVCRSTVTTSLGAGSWSWILPHDFLTNLFGAPTRGKNSASSASPVEVRQHLESLARDMSTQLTIRLGGVQLSPAQLGELQVGDLVVLNQRTTEPLRAMMSGKPKFLGWPGRVGNRQAFEIAAEGARLGKTAESSKSSVSPVGR